MRLHHPAFLRFIAVAGGIASLAIWHTASRLNSGLPAGSPFRALVWGLTILTWCFPILRLLTMSRGGGQRLQNVGFFFLGFGATLLFSLLALDLIQVVVQLAGFMLPLWTPLSLAGLSLAFSIAGYFSAMKGAVVRHVPIEHAGLHRGLEGLRIAQISDLHIGSMLGESYVRQIVDAVMKAEPDLIAITGDLVDGPRHELKDAIAPLADLKARLGVHYVSGNHEYIWGAKAWTDDFRKLGFQVLDNAHRALSFGGASLNVLGINDLSAGRFGSGDGPDHLKAAHGAPEADFTLFLAHQPQAWPLAEAVGADLMLSGHTHGGQFFPFQGIVSLFHRYFRGLYRHEGKFWVYVNPGAGFWGPPSRLGVPCRNYPA